MDSVSHEIFSFDHAFIHRRYIITNECFACNYMFRPGDITGQIGEETVAVFLMKQKYKLIERNYWKKWGEIDIVAEKEGIIHFIEVKAVSREILDDVFREDEYKPEDNVHPQKIRRLRRVIQSYVFEKDIDEGKWQFDIAAVFMDHEKKQAKIRLTEDIVL